MREQSSVRDPIHDLLAGGIDGADSLVELALDMRWSGAFPTVLSGSFARRPEKPLCSMRANDCHANSPQEERR
jgi:hypothetical protein